MSDYIDDLKDRVAEAVKVMRKMYGEDAELVLIVPTIDYRAYRPSVWESFEGIDHIEHDDTLCESFYLMTREAWLQTLMSKITKESEQE